MAGKRYTAFEKKTIGFLRELDANNNREWFNANKSRYENDVLDVALHFIQTMQDPLAEIAPHFTAVPTRIGGSLMRIYRDTRFSKNKLPYKTNIGIQFRHERAKDVHSPATTCISRRTRYLSALACGVRIPSHCVRFVNASRSDPANGSVPSALRRSGSISAWAENRCSDRHEASIRNTPALTISDARVLSRCAI